MKSIRKSYRISAPIERVWKAFFDLDDINNWGDGPAKMDEVVGSKFSLWNGDIYGTNKEIKKHERLVQDWYAGKWKGASKAAFSFKKISPQETQVDLIHTGIPESEYEEINKGWDQYYLGEIKKLLEK